LVKIISCPSYFIDIPRTLGVDDNMNNIITNLEDLKNGHMLSNMYGQHNQLYMDPPHIIILSNRKCPVKKMSNDPCKRYEINSTTLKLVPLDD
jgi:hypothetical protein